MKDEIKKIILIGLCLFLIPFIMIELSGENKGDLLMQFDKENEEQTSTDTLLDESQIVPILARSIPYTYEYEAIKAQAVIIRTNMARKAMGLKTNINLNGYTEEEMKNLWQNNYEAIYETYIDVVKETENEMILYHDEPIQALYHTASSGKTRSAEEVYDVSVPYLVSVDSQIEHVNKQVKISKERVVQVLTKNYPEIIIDEDQLENQIQIIEKDEAGYIKSIQIGNLIIKGEELRNVLEIPSCNFKIFTDGTNLIFDVNGQGHGIGLSQNGANELAKQGKNYQEILNYYYKEIEIKKYQ